MELIQELESLHTSGGGITVGLVGAGFMGRGIVEVVESVPGMSVGAIFDVDQDRAVRCFTHIGVPPSKITRDPRGWSATDGTRLIVGSLQELTDLTGVDILVEATGVPEVGAETAYRGLMAGTHVAMLNVETDVTVGHLLAATARRAGLVYTVCAGDEPAAIVELCDFARMCGFEVIACGKGKNNPLDFHATPRTLAGRAEEMGLNPRILTEFVDGSKTMVEMGCVANARGFTVDRRNMHGPQAGTKDLVSLFRPRGEGGLLERTGVVDYAIGDVAPGVFAVVRHEGEIANHTLRYLRIGEGPYYLLYRPYHLTNLEVPRTIAWACLRGKPTLSKTSRPTTEVIALAKRDLRRGEEIDHIGGFCVYGGLETAATAEDQNLLPLGLAQGSVMTRDVAGDQALTRDDVALRDTLLLQLRKLQERLP